MAGKLYVVGTPIGNLGDMTYRAVETLEAVDFICAEDTRVTAKLLNYFEIKKPMVSHHAHNLRESCAAVLARILAGESCAVVSDAGMPCISDPGEELVRICAEHGIEVCAVPAASAAVTALAISGLPTARFSFEGFLSVNKKSRRVHLAAAAKLTSTLIFYEAPHKLLPTLRDMLASFGDRRISLCRELTKVYEEVVRTTLSEAVTRYRAQAPRGEFVLVIEGAQAEEEPSLTVDDAAEQARALVAGGMRAADACRTVAKDTGFTKSELYARLLEQDA
ncbi:MAG: 16S rRNA (cytidine(1402)-2'-O)-methyltransferase [Oscillospiraceae bacterium]